MFWTDRDGRIWRRSNSGRWECYDPIQRLWRWDIPPAHHPHPRPDPWWRHCHCLRGWTRGHRWVSV